MVKIVIIGATPYVAIRLRPDDSEHQVVLLAIDNATAKTFQQKQEGCIVEMVLEGEEFDLTKTPSLNNLRSNKRSTVSSMLVGIVEDHYLVHKGKKKKAIIKNTKTKKAKRKKFKSEADRRQAVVNLQEKYGDDAPFRIALLDFD